MSVTQFGAASRRVARGAALLIALFVSAAATALTIGEVELQSQVGEPLRASVPLGNIGTLSADQILVGRAAEDTYRTYGVDRSSFNSPLKFELAVDASGNARVAISTRHVVSEPFVDLVMEVRWPSGRAVRQFTLLLDLPPQ